MLLYPIGHNNLRYDARCLHKQQTRLSSTFIEFVSDFMLKGKEEKLYVESNEINKVIRLKFPVTHFPV